MDKCLQGTDIVEILGQRIKRLIEEKRIPKQDAANDLGWSRAKLYKLFEREKIAPKELKRIASLLSMSTEDLLTGSDTKGLSERIKQLLVIAVRDVELLLAKRDLTLPPKQKAKLLASVVDRAVEIGRVDTRSIEELIGLLTDD